MQRSVRLFHFRIFQPSSATVAKPVGRQFDCIAPVLDNVYINIQLKVERHVHLFKGTFFGDRFV